MLGRLGRSLTVVASLAAWPAVAHADGSGLFHVCGGDNFSTCAAVSVNVVGQNVTMQVWNYSGNSSLNGGVASNPNAVLASIGFLNLPSGVTLDTQSLSQSGTSGWSLQNGGMSVVPADGSVGGPPGIAAGQSATFTFNLSGGTWDPSNFAFSVRAQDATTGQWSECRNNGGISVCNAVTVTPEPMSMTLLATGLAGMGGAGFIRRRRMKLPG